MKPTGLILLALATVAFAAPQSVDELHIPEENDNQFPPDNNMETDRSITEGSGAGAIEDPIYLTTTTESVPPPVLEDVQLNSEIIKPTDENSEDSCPKPCVCHIEGDSNNYVVDCSGYGLTEFPQSIDTKTTTLNLQNNKLTEIPKEVSLLKNLKVLNADNNSIMDLASGSISELPELTVLKLSNNRLVEYPKDLKNGFGLTKLEELDLGGNDMRTSLNRDIFSHFTALKKLTLPTDTKELLDDICISLKKSLITICTESCSVNTFECPEAPEEDLLNFILPGTISLSSVLDGNADLALPENVDANSDKVDTTVASEVQAGAESKVDSDKVDTTEASEVQTEVESNANSDKLDTSEAPKLQPEIEPDVTLKVPDTNTEVEPPQSEVNKAPEGISPLSTVVEAPLADHKEADVDTTSGSQTGGLETPEVPENNSGAEFSLRSAVNKAPAGISQLSTVVEAPKEAADDHKDTEVAVGATTSGTNTGGVDKSVIGMIVAGMVLVVAGITIKKNWSSIKTRFSSTPRAAANERPGASTNGTAPEEVPLQEKSPV